jgi:hypothetical protein
VDRSRSCGCAAAVPSWGMDRECDYGNVKQTRSLDVQLKDRLVQSEDAAGNCFGVNCTRARDHRRDAAMIP